MYPGTPPAGRRVSGQYTWTRVLALAQGNQVSGSPSSVDWVASNSAGFVLGDTSPKIGGTTATMQVRWIETGPDLAEPTLLHADISVAVR